ncbi:hypothetical protein [Flavobacterium cerinum]|uniref:Uncharacterized protein n=1 Tax=Flavobacterium cerinum TaxID=2502784 RepID=A0ABY5IQB9_9FLAO|nr:hypothetical protein [Flavobacterium cerinum]UUC44465.1 hypothetical protein NOX80_12585 [Flavobacterium cerinum]
MDRNTITILRSRISIPLDVAIQLLRENKGDIDASEQAFHNNNIKEIMLAAECDHETAKKHYELYKYNITKAIKKINSKEIVITTSEIPTGRNAIGFILWPENNDRVGYESTKRNDVFIPYVDFNLVINEFESVFPLQNPWNKMTEDSFDNCGHNYIDNKSCRIIVERIKQSKTDDPKVIEFKKQLIEWLDDKLSYADYITVYGNL